tara:strand:- start:634 stop:990 length:357 start_codon:yes stop_codon:yes gene_type:complete
MKKRPITRLVDTCIRYANTIHINKTPPNVLLNYIMVLIERIENIDDASYPAGYKKECKDKCWDCYKSVLYRINSNEDESWNNAVSDGVGHWKPKVHINYYGEKFEEATNYIAKPDDNQ